ncbi:MAG TPA: hypothetical protein VEJ23_09165 [Solirubrobacteraceae bacterium]|nr:hypothetical protein [Solirubrobacteraceae bacterium]
MAITLMLGLALIAVALIVVVLQSPDEVISSNSTIVTEELGLLRQHTFVCQEAEGLPAAATAVRVSIGSIAHPGPAVLVSFSDKGHIVASGHRAGGWIGASLALPLTARVTAFSGTTICLTRGPATLPVGLAGGAAPSASVATVNGKALPGRLRVEYLRRGQRSWLSLAEHVARRLGLGRSPAGTWIVLPLLAMMAAAIALCVWLLMRETPA